MKTFNKTIATALAMILFLGCFFSGNLDVSAVTLEMSQIYVTLSGAELGNRKQDLVLEVSEDRQDKYSVDIAAAYVGNDVSNEAANGIQMSDTDTFLEGESYVLHIRFTAKENVRFSGGGHTAETFVNRQELNPVAASSEEIRVNYLVEIPGEAAAELIPNVEVLDVVEPKVGEAPCFDYTVPEGANYKANGGSWYESEGEINYYGSLNWATEITESDTDYKFKAGRHYAFVADLITEDDTYKFRNTTTATMNGKEAFQICYASNGIQVGYELASFEPLPTYAITMTKAKAYMDSERVDEASKGDVITIVANEPSEGYEFYEWEVVSGDVVIQNPNASTTTFIMGETPVEIKAVNKKPHTHKYKSSKSTTKATMSADGAVVLKYTCSCGDSYEEKTTIPKISSVKLSYSSVTYNGKVKTPTVTVRDSKGKKLVADTDYRVSGLSGRKNVGTYTCKVTFKGSYSGTESITFTIEPKTTTISKVTATKKGFKVTWKKQSTQTTGYQLQYSTSSKFTKDKVVTVAKNGTTSKSIGKLLAKKRYYVRIRTYKSVGSKKIYSSWSGAKKVTTK